MRTSLSSLSTSVGRRVAQYIIRIIFELCICIVLYKIQEPEIRIISYCFYGHLTQLRTYVSLRRVPLSDRTVRAGRRQIATVVQLYSSELYCE